MSNEFYDNFCPWKKNNMKSKKELYNLEDQVFSEEFVNDLYNIIDDQDKTIKEIQKKLEAKIATNSYPDELINQICETCKEVVKSGMIQPENLPSSNILVKKTKNGGIKFDLTGNFSKIVFINDVINSMRASLAVALTSSPFIQTVSVNDYFFIDDDENYEENDNFDEDDDFIDEDEDEDDIYSIPLTAKKKVTKKKTTKKKITKKKKENDDKIALPQNVLNNPFSVKSKQLDIE